jgi:hypothetical protein
LGDQVLEDKLAKMVRQVAYIGMVVGFFSLGWAEDRKAGVSSSSKDGEEITPTPKQMQNFLSHHVNISSAVEMVLHFKVQPVQWV